MQQKERTLDFLFHYSNVGRIEYINVTTLNYRILRYQKCHDNSINPILTGSENINPRSVIQARRRACITVRGLIFLVLPDKTVNIEVITRLRRINIISQNIQ